MRYKKLIPDLKTNDIERTQEYWEKIHCEDDYKPVWSMTEDKGVRKKNIDELNKLPSCAEILILGCGSKTLLQNDLAESLLNCHKITCTDFSKVIEYALSQENNSKIVYEAKDSADLQYEDQFDVVVVVNSILSDSDQENREILSSCFKALKPGGSLIGFFPSVFCALDMAYLEDDFKRAEQIDLKRNTYSDEIQEVTQIFYTPLRLRMVMQEAEFSLNKMEIYFCDSPYFLNHTKEFYGIEDPDVVIWEQLVVAKKALN